MLGKAKKRASFFLLTLMTVVVVFLLSGCPGIGGGGTTIANFVKSVENLESIPEKDPAYALTVFTDEELVRTLGEVAGYFPSEVPFEIPEIPPTIFVPGSRALGTLEKETLSALLKEYTGTTNSTYSIEELIEWCETVQAKNILDKVSRALNAIHELLKASDRYDYCVEIKGSAKEQILRAFNRQNDFRSLFFDFRDAIYIASMLRTIVFLCDTKEFWIDLNNYITNVSQGSSPRFRGLGKILEHMDKQVLYFVEVYNFEMSKTNAYGYRIDGKRTLYQLFLNEQQKISFVKDAGNQEFRSVPGLSKLKIGKLSVTEKTKMINIIKEIGEALPNSVLTIEWTYQVQYYGTESGRISFDFSKIASKNPFNFGNVTYRSSQYEFYADIENGAIVISAKRN